MKKQLLVLTLLALLVAMRVNAAFVLNEDFNSISSGVPTGWSNAGGTCTSSSYLWQSTTSGYDGSGVVFNSAYATSGSTGWLQSPTLSLAGDYVLKFVYQNYNAGQLDVYLSSDGGATLGTKIASNLTTASSTEWGTFETSLTIKKRANTYKLIFVSTANYKSTKQYLDNVQIETYPTCKTPESIYMANLTSTSADVNWSLSAIGYDIPTYIQMTVRDEQGTLVHQNNQIPGYDNYYSLTGLQPATRYTLQMRGDCDSNDPNTGLSLYSGFSDYSSYSFTTACHAIQMPYNENFDAMNEIGICMHDMNAKISTTAAQSGRKSLALNATESDVAYIIFPLLDVASNDVEVSFNTRTTSAQTTAQYMVGIVADLSDVFGSFEPLYIDSVNTTTWTNIRMNTSTARMTTSQTYIMILVSSGADVTMYIDDISIHSIPTCIRPEQLAITNIGDTTVTLNWTTSNATQHIVYATDAMGNVMRKNVGVPPCVVGGLQPNSSYSFQVRGYCNASDSSDINPMSVSCKTLCTPSATPLWSEGAEGTTGTAIPDCWRKGFWHAPTSSYTTYVGFSTQTTTVHNGSRAFKLEDMPSGTRSYLISNGFYVNQANAYDASIWIYRPTGTTYNGEGLALWVSNNSTDTTGAQYLGFINRQAGLAPIESNGTGWYQYKFPINKTGLVYLIVEGRSQYGSSTYFDDIEILVAPTCHKVTDITMGSATSTSNTVSWTPSSNNESQWVVAYTLKLGNNIVATDSTVVNQPSLTLNNLSNASTYTLNITVYALCTPTDMSEGTSLTSTFSTPCGVITFFPYREDFESQESSELATCWDNSASTAYTYYSDYIWGVYETSSGNVIRMYNYYVQKGEAVVDMPAMTFPQKPMNMTFDYSNLANCGDMNVQISTDGGANFTTIGTYSQGGSTSETNPGTMTSATIDLSSYAGQNVILRFRAVANYSQGAIFVDNIVIRSTSSCQDLDCTIGQVDGTTAVINTDASAACNWQISIGALPGDSIIQVNSATSYTLTGLQPSTSYTVYVRRDCGNEQGDWSRAKTFRTTKLCADVTATLSLVTENSVTVTSSLATGNWQISIGAQPGDSIIDVTSARYTVTGLAPLTQYTMYVRNNCGFMYGDWSPAYRFTTLAVPEYVPYQTGFENDSDNVKWTIVNGSAASNVWIFGSDASAVASGSKALYMSTGGQYGYANASTKTFAYRTLGFRAETYTVSFKWKCTGGESNFDFGRVMLVPASDTIQGGTGGSYSYITWPNYIEAFDPEDKDRMNLTEGDANGWNIYSTTLDMTNRAGIYNFVVMWNNDGSAQTGPEPLAIDNLSITNLTCFEPTILHSGTTSNGTTIDVNSMDASAWQVVVSSNPIDPFGVVSGDIADTIITNSTLAITGLTTNTAYYYTARGICNPGDTSNWASPKSFRTSCAAYEIPYSEGFEDVNSLTCWNSFNTGTFERNTTVKHAGSASCNIANEAAISPELNTPSLATYMINGFAYSNADSTTFSVGVIVDPADVSTSDILEDVFIQNSGEWSEFTAYFTLLTDPSYAAVANAKHVAIVASSDVSIYIDDIIIGPTPTCPKPTAPSITNILANSATVNWTDNAGASSWIVKATPVNGGTVITDTVSAHPCTITGLNGSTAYNVTVKAICGAGDVSYPTDCGTFRTACSTINTPWVEDFETYSVAAVPDCWDNSTSTTTPITSAWTISQYNSNKLLRVNEYYGSRNGLSVITSPIITLAAGRNYAFGFDYDCASTSITNPSVSISTNGGSSWTTLSTLPTGTSSSAGSSNPTPGTLTHYDFDLSTYAGNNVMFKFQCTTNYGSGGLFIDNISVREGSICAKPTNVATSNITGNSVTVSWTAGSETQWVIKTTANNVSKYDTVTTNPYTVTGLSASTSYQVAVSALCSDGGVSAYSTAASFKTACGTVSLPWVEDFNSYSNLSVLDCWSTTGTTSTASSASYIWGVYQTTSFGNTMRMNNAYVQSGSTMITSPQIQLPSANSSELKFKYCHQSSGGNMIVKMHSVGSSNWTILGTYQKGSGTSNYAPTSFIDITIDLTAFKGQTVELKFEATSDYSSGAIFVDDISITELRPCRNPLGVAATANDTSASVTITDTISSHTQWQYAYGYTGFDVEGATPIMTTAKTFTINGLTESTSYDIYVRAYCDAAEQSNWIMGTFKTTTAPAEMPYICDFDDPQQNGGWEFNSTGTNSFVIGSDLNAIARGTAAMYVSSGSQTYSYAISTASRAVAYRLFQFNESTYHFEFDWKLTGGEILSGTYYDYGRFYLIPASTGVALPPTGSFSASGWPSNMIALDGNAAKSKVTSPTWNTVSTDIDFTGRSGNYYLVFAWVNDASSGTNTYPLSINNVYVREILCPDLTANPTIDNTTMSSITVSAPMAQKHAGILFAYGPAATTTTIADTVGSVYSTTGQAVITGLQPATAYKIFAAGICQSGDTTIWTSEVTGTTMASDCFEPQNLRLVGLASDSTATVCWGGSPTAIEYEYQLTGTPMQGTTTSDTLVLTGLTPATSHTLQVRTICSDGPTQWVSITFSTTIAPAPLPYMCDWETASESNQWVLINGSTGMQFVVGSGTSNGGANALYISDDGLSYSYGVSSTAISAVYAQRFFNLPAGQYSFTYDWQCQGESTYDYGRAFIAPASMTFTAGNMPSDLSETSIPSGCISLDNSSKLNLQTGWQTIQGTINVTTAGSYKMTFFWKNDGSVFKQPPLAIDNIQFARLTCPSPTIGTITAGTTTASTTITTNSSTIIYAVTTGSITDVTEFDTLIGTKNISLTNLSPSSQYYLYVKAHCGEGDESFWVKKSFRTTCGVISQYPYTEGFESVGTTYTGATMINDICWGQIGAASSTSSYPKYFATTSYSATEGSKALQLMAGSGQSLILYLPEFATPGNKRMTFDFRTESTSTSCGVLHYGYVTNTSSASSFVSLGIAPRNTTYTNYAVDYGTLPAGARLAVKYTDAGYSSYYAWIDNIVVTELVQGPTYSGSVCYNEPYTNYGFNVAAEDLTIGNNIKNRLKKGQVGAPDTLITANIYKYPDYYNEIEDSTCAGNAYTSGIFTIPTPRTRPYYRTFQSTTGCDSTVTLNMYVQETRETWYDTICQGASYQFAGKTYTTTGTYIGYLQSAMGCTDTVTLHLNVVPSQNTYNETICNGESFTWHGQVLTQGGTYPWTGTGDHGCTISETLNLTVLDGDSTMSMQLCPGSQYLFRDTIITSAGVYKRSYYDFKIGCQVTITLNVTMTAAREGNVYDYVCEGKLYSGYGINNLQVINDTIVDVHTRTSDNQCDSTGHVHISVIPTVYSYESATLSEGGTYLWNNQTYTSPGTYIWKGQSVVTGCDSIAELHLKGVGLDYAEALEMTVVPNPVNAGETAYIYGNFGEITSVEILNQFGQVIARFEPTGYPIEVGGISADGMYYVRVTLADGRTAVRKLIVK